MFNKHSVVSQKLTKILKLICLILTVYTIAVFGTAVFSLYKIETEKLDFSQVDFQNLKKQKPTILCENFLDGALQPVDDSPEQNQIKCDYNIPLSVVIDNEISAPAPAGLAEAEMVFETLVEGGITRYLAFFDSDDEIIKIGPVRSTRPYFLDWAEGQRALLAHSGGSPAALRQLSAGRSGLIDLDEIGATGVYFFRDSKKLAPHNLYTSSQLLKTALEIKYNLFQKTNFWTKAELATFYDNNKWQYQDQVDLVSQPPEAVWQSKPIIINFSTFGYKVKYKYNFAEQNYLRYLADKIQLTEIGESIKVKNIIIIWLKTYNIDDLRLGMQTVGQGQALVCHSGVCLDGRWQKDKPETRIQFFDSNDQKIALTRGNTWIEVLPAGREVEY